MGFPRQEYWTALPFPPPGDLPDPAMEPGSPALADGFFALSHLGSPVYILRTTYLIVSDIHVDLDHC